mmetsp:Transcript_74936/g.243434  ORF Transcript_74936/g.243434 Transcript_74936/m.243434 type:complete len:387 (+) Transcript_74936:1800-2960(+)
MRQRGRLTDWCGGGDAEPVPVLDARAANAARGARRWQLEGAGSGFDFEGLSPSGHTVTRTRGAGVDGARALRSGNCTPSGRCGLSARLQPHRLRSDTRGVLPGSALGHCTGECRRSACYLALCHRPQHCGRARRPSSPGSQPHPLCTPGLRGRPHVLSWFQQWQHRPGPQPRPLVLAGGRGAHRDGEGHDAGWGGLIVYADSGGAGRHVENEDRVAACRRGLGHRLRRRDGSRGHGGRARHGRGSVPRGSADGGGHCNHARASEVTHRDHAPRHGISGAPHGCQLGLLVCVGALHSQRRRGSPCNASLGTGTTTRGSRCVGACDGEALAVGGLAGPYSCSSSSRRDGGIPLCRRACSRGKRARNCCTCTSGTDTAGRSPAGVAGGA